MLSCRLFILFQVFAYGICSDEADMPIQYVKTITDADFDGFVKASNSSHVRVVYFYKKDFPKLNSFLIEYEKAAEAISIYDVQFGMVDCTQHKVDEYCNKEYQEKFLHTFKEGHHMIDLDLENLFDVNAILSNILQIVLLREVPIAQTISEFTNFQKYNIRKRDVILSYHKAIGTYAHRILMEVAFVYHTSYQFLLTTRGDVVQHLPHYNDMDESAIWLLRCKNAHSEDGFESCDAVKYRDTMNLVSLARFLRALDLPAITTVPGEHDLNFYQMNDMHTIICLYDGQVYAEALKLSQEIIKTFRGIVGVVLVDINTLPSLPGGFQPKDPLVPAIGFKSRNDAKFDMAPPGSDIEYLLSEQLANLATADMISTRLDSAGDDDEKEETEDDDVARISSQLRDEPLNLTHVTVLTDKTFTDAVARPQILIILFYLIFDARSMLFLRSYVGASHILAADATSPLATVNCHDWPDVCVNASVTVYPTIRVYPRDTSPSVYSGLLSTAAIVTTARLLLEDVSLTLTSVREADEFLAGRRPSGIGDVTPVSVLGLFSDGQSPEYMSFNKAARELHGQVLLGSIIGEAATKMASTLGVSIPRIVIRRRNDDFQRDTTTEAPTCSTQLIDKINLARLPVFPELAADNFAVYLSYDRPLAILFVHGTVSEAYRVLGGIAAEGKLSGITLCWMNLDGEDRIAQQVLQTYQAASDPGSPDVITGSVAQPALSLIDHATGTIYHYKAALFTSEAVFTWLSAVASGSMQPSGELRDNEWQPARAPIDFLQLMEDEQHRTPPVVDEDAVMEKEGLGFDQDGNYVGLDATYESGPQTVPETRYDATARTQLSERMRSSRLHDDRLGDKHTEL